VKESAATPRPVYFVKSSLRQKPFERRWRASDILGSLMVIRVEKLGVALVDLEATKTTVFLKPIIFEFTSMEKVSVDEISDKIERTDKAK
jgi:hypothetical protein